uniref:Prolyl endopeptidase n=2 Tax=Babesia bovis TaxID=5865 RepID=A7ATC9_BABBO|eukprot:XP_001609758.1 hypothetical protein [Babesia bovis T2Bo]
MLDQHDLDYSIDFSGVPKTIINIPRKNGVRYSISTLPSKTLKHVCRRWKKSGLGIAQSDSGSTHRRYVWFKLNQINEAIVTDIDMTCNALVLYLSIPPSKPMVATLRFARKGRRREYRTAESAMYNLNIPVGVGVIEPRGNTNFYGTYVRFIIRTPGSGDIHCYVDLANDHNIGTEKNNSGMNEHLDGSNNICSKVKLHKPIPPQVFCSALNRHLPLHSTHYIDSRDGSCKIPITLVRFGSDTTNDVNAAFRNPRNKCVVYFYGAYGHNLAVDNDLEHNILLQMGYTLCFAHVRGGGELGHIWHSGAVKSFKYKGVYDLIDVIEFLIANNMAQRSSIALSSTSAGAILAACVYNMRPDLCNCISLKLPFLDVFGSIHDTNEPLSSLEKEEFGNESNVECVYSYSPCDNTGEPGHLKPSLIIQCNSDDTRAPLRHTVSYIRQHRTNWDRTFLRISSGGHTDGNTAEEHEQWITERISIMENLLEGYVA